MADMRHDAVQTLNQALSDVNFKEVLARIDLLAEACQVRLDSAGVRFVAVDESIALDMLFTGQTHTLQVSVQRAQLTPDGLRKAFTDAYQNAFGRVLEGPVIRVMNLRYARIGRRPKFDLSVLAPVGAGSTQPLGVQRVYHQGKWWDAQRYDRLALPVGAQVLGPAILEQADTTVWLEPGFQAKVDPMGNLLVTS
jgi:N-methylhydantoinase A